MRDIFSEGLLYLDLLEVYGSSHLVAELCGVAQSNAYRGAISCAKLLALDLQKHDGRYVASQNQDVLADLRRVNQRLRVRQAGRLRVMVDPLFAAAGLPGASSDLQVLPKAWLDLSTTMQYLEQSILDLVVVRGLEWVHAFPCEQVPRLKGQPWRHGDYLASVLHEEPLRLFVATDHSLLRAGSLRPEQLAIYPSPDVERTEQGCWRSLLRPHGLCTQRVSGSRLQAGQWEEQVYQDGWIVPSCSTAMEAYLGKPEQAGYRVLPYQLQLKEQAVLLVNASYAAEARLRNLLLQWLSPSLQFVGR
jgi:DNA-binding transcriptional LysR family regulator